MARAVSTQQPAPGRRRPEAEETRQRLLAAGRRAFARRGLAGANLKGDILEPADVSVGSFYHQFRDKTELLLAILAEHSRVLRARLSELHRPAPGRTALSIAHDAYAMVLEMAERHEDLLRIQLRERDSEDPRVRDFLRSDRERWTRSLAEDYRRIARAGGHEVDADLAAQLVVGLSLGAVAQLLDLPPDERPRARERLQDGLVRFTLGGVGALTRPERGGASP